MQRQGQSTREWSRSGCATCKRRRKKCDEGKPSCGPCTRLDLCCDYQSIWRDPKTQTNKPYRRSRKTVRRPDSFSLPVEPSQGDGFSTFGLDDGFNLSVISQDHQENAWDSMTTSGQILSVLDNITLPEAPHHDELREDVLEDGALVSSTIAESSPLQNLPFSNASAILGIQAPPDTLPYLSYYVSHLSSWLVMVDATSNPLRQTIIPRISASPMLLQAVCAAAACHLSQRSHDTLSASQHSVAATKMYMRTMVDLNKTLSRRGACRQSLSGLGGADSAILTAAFLCKYEIIRGSTREWRYHLTGLTKLMDEVDTFSSVSHAAKRFLKSFMVYHREIAQITSGGNIHDDIPMPAALADQSLASDEELDPYMGFTERIVGLLGRTSRLLHLETEQAVEDEALSIYTALQSWNIDNLSYLIPLGVSPADIQNLHLTATAFHSAAFTYFYSILLSLRTRAAHLSTPFSPSKTPLLTDIASGKEVSVEQCFDALRHIPSGLPCESALVLPLFILGCESGQMEHQDYAIERLKNLEVNVGIGNIQRARRIVEQVQQQSVQGWGLGQGLGLGQGGWRCEVEEGPRWNRITDRLGWDVIIT